MSPIPAPVSPIPAPVSPLPGSPLPAPVSPIPAPVSPLPGSPLPAPVSPIPAPVSPLPGSPLPAPVSPLPGSPLPAPVSPIPGSPLPAPVSPIPGSLDISNIPDVSAVAVPDLDQPAEPELVPQLPSAVAVGDLPPLSFTEVPDATKRSKPRPISSHNHVYNFKKTLKRTGATVWQCSVRSKLTYCTAVITQLGATFTPGSVPHKCTPKPSALPASKVQSQIRDVGASQTYTPAASIVADALRQHMKPGAPTDALPQLPSLIRQTNKLRQRNHPPNPTTLDFTVIDDVIPPGFLQEDIKTPGSRHMIFYTEHQLQLLRVAREWYVDGTFRCVGLPFQQLLSIHAFINQNQSTKQVPLVFVLMSGRSAADYTAVLEKIPGRPSVIMSDFEAALRSSVLQLLPTTEHKGCCFHWCQAVWRKVQQLGLAVTYQEDVAVNKFIRRIFSLPFIPAPSIEPIVRGILSLDTPATPMAAPIKELVQYVRTSWVDSQQWPPSSWSVFQRSVRTNNDCEGYHGRINSKIRRDHLPFYQLVDLLHAEASLVSIHAQFVADDKLKRDQRSRYRNQQGKILCLWEQYTAGDIDVKELLSSEAN